MDNALNKHSENELSHHGIKGQKWGVLRFQNKDGSLTPEGRKRYNKGSGTVGNNESNGQSKKKHFLLSRSVLAKRQKNNKEKTEMDEETDIKSLKEKDPVAYEAAKQKALKSGSATDIVKFKGDLTSMEIQNALNRIDWEQKLISASAKEMASGEDKINKLFTNVGKVTNYANTAIKAYNTIANVHNAVNVNSKLLPTISTDITTSNREQQKKENKERSKIESAKKKMEQQIEEGKEKHDARSKKKEEQTNNTGNSSTNNTGNSSTNNTGNSSTNKSPKFKTSRFNKTNNSESEKTTEWTVEGKGTSFKNNDDKDKSKSSDYYEPFDVDSDADWVYEYGGKTSMSNINTETLSIGKSKIEQFLLEDKKGR